MWAGFGNGRAALDKYSVSARQDFDVEDLESDIRNTVEALAIKLGDTFSKRLNLRLAERLDPNMPEEVRKAIEAELDEVAADEAQERATTREALQGADLSETQPLL